MEKENEKKSFVVYHDWYDSVKQLDDETLGKLLRCMFEHHIDGAIQTKLSPNAAMAFTFMKNTFIRDREKYLATCAKNRANAINRWNKDKKTNTTEYDGSDRMQPNANDADSESDLILLEKVDNDSESVIERRHAVFVFVFSRAFLDQYKIKYQPKPSDKAAANELALKIMTPQKHVYEYLYRYFKEIFKNSNQFHRERMTLEHLNKYHSELHMLIMNENGTPGIMIPNYLYDYKYMDDIVKREFPQHFPDPPASPDSTPANMVVAGGNGKNDVSSSTDDDLPFN